MKIPAGLKTLFLVHFVVALFFGLVDLLFPEAFYQMFGVTITDPQPYRMIGAAVLAFGAGSWWAYKAAEWDKVKIVVQMELVWTILASLLLLIGLLFLGRPAAEWLNFVIMAGFAAFFAYFYSKK